MNACDRHPQKQQIIDAILAGKSLRQIATGIDPVVHHATIARFRVALLATAAQTMRGKSGSSQAVKQLIDSCDPSKSVSEVNSNINNELRTRVHSAIDKRLTRREGWISEAESVPLRDAKGKILRDAAGEVVTTLDHRALAAHDGNELKDLRTIAELGGLLQQSGPAVQVNAVIMMPGPSAGYRESQEAEAIEIAQPGVIDVEVAR